MSMSFYNDDNDDNFEAIFDDRDDDCGAHPDIDNDDDDNDNDDDDDDDDSDDDDDDGKDQPSSPPLSTS